MKLVWHDGLDTLSRSMKGVTGRPLSFSVSLCGKKKTVRNKSFFPLMEKPSTLSQLSP